MLDVYIVYLALYHLNQSWYHLYQVLHHLVSASVKMLTAVLWSSHIVVMVYFGFITRCDARLKSMSCLQLYS